MKNILKITPKILFNSISINDIVKFAKKSTPLFLRNFLILIIGILQVCIFTHYVTPKTYGIYQYVISILAILAPFTLPGIDTAIVRCASKNQEFVYYSLVKKRIKWATFASILLIIYALYLYIYKEALELSIIFAISAIFYPFYYTIQTYIPLLNGREFFSSMAKYQIAYALLAFFLITISVLVWGNLILIFLSMFIGCTLFNIYVFINIKPKAGPKIDKVIFENKFKDSLKYGKHITAIGTLPAIESWIDRIVIGLYFGFVDLAVFSIAKLFQNQLKSLWVVFSQILHPISFKNNEKNDKIFLFKAFVLIFLLFFGLILLLELILPEIIPLLFTKLYSDSILYSQLILLVIVIGLPGSVFGIFLRTHSKIKSLYILRILTPLVYFLSLPLFIKFSGLIGIIFAMYTKNIFYSLLTIFFVYKGRK